MSVAATKMDWRALGQVKSDRQREINVIWYHVYVESKKYNKLVNKKKKKQTYIYRIQTWLSVGREGGGITGIEE